LNIPFNSTCFLVLAITWTIFSYPTFAQSNANEVDIDKVTVSYTFNFANNIQWPNSQSRKSFSIGLFRIENQSLVNEFLKLHNKVFIKGKTVKIYQSDNLNKVDDFDLLFVGKTDDETITQVYNRIIGKPVLMVTSNYSNQRLVMLNIFKNEAEQLLFEINKANLLNNNLKPLPELILLGGTEIDVAKLYREGQNSLLKLQDQVQTQKSKLKTLENNISNQRRTNTRLIEQMQYFSNEILNMKKQNIDLNSELQELNKTIEKSKDTIKQQKTEIQNSEKKQANLISEVQNRNKELTEKEEKLQQRQQQLNTISLTILNKEAELNSLNTTINEQQKEIQNQKTSIVALDKLVSTQQKSLYFLWGLVVAGTALFFVAIYAYRTKRRDNERLAQQTHDLQVARDKLEIEKRKAEEANRTKSAFLSLMSHELRTPLQSIIGYTDLIIEDLRSEGDTNYSDQLIRVNSNGERLLELINNTLDLAKIEAGKMEVKLTPTNIRALVDEALDNVKPLLAKNENQFTVDIDNHHYSPEIDYEKSLHILVNLLSNANKFTQQGKISVSVKNSPQKLVFTISDTGIGMTSEQLATIFDHFQQVNRGKLSKLKGSGLGLSITQHFCEIMGGTIGAESKKDQGTSFTVEIPLPVTITDKKFIGMEENETRVAAI
jgi:signal transduction histidine kinase